MPHPVKKHTRSRTGKRRTHHALTPTDLTVCPKCKSPKRPHYACENCGTYRGRDVVTVATALDKKRKKKNKEKEKNEAKQEPAS